MDLITTRMFCERWSERLHCFMAKIPSSGCRVGWVSGEMWIPCLGLWHFCVQNGNTYSREECSSESLFLALWKPSLQDSSWGAASGESVSWAPCQFLDGCGSGLGLGACPHRAPAVQSAQPAQMCLLCTFHYVHSELCFTTMEDSKSLRWDNLVDHLNYKITYENITHSWVVINRKVRVLFSTG